MVALSGLLRTGLKGVEGFDGREWVGGGGEGGVKKSLGVKLFVRLDPQEGGS